MNVFKATHVIVTPSGGEIPVIFCDSGDGNGPNGPCYTRVEWEADDAADWEYWANDALYFQGQQRPGHKLVRK